VYKGYLRRIAKSHDLLEKHQLVSALLKNVTNNLQYHCVKISHSTIVNATIIHAPVSTKNKDKTRDPDMHQA